jgi:hypothetical protein
MILKFAKRTDLSIQNSFTIDNLIQILHAVDRVEVDFSRLADFISQSGLNVRVARELIKNQ